MEFERIVGPILVAIVAASLGAYYALSKIKRERLWIDRYEALRKLVLALHTIQDYFEAVHMSSMGVSVLRESEEVTVRSPNFDPLEIDVTWKALPQKLMYDILGLAYRIEQLNREVAEEWEDDAPEYTEFFWARQYGYAVLCLTISELAQRLLARSPPILNSRQSMAANVLTGV